MKKVFEEAEVTYFEYKPSIFKPFYVNLERLSLRRRIRFLLGYFSGYSVYYMVKDDDYIGYCVIQNGRDRRYKFATEEDIIVGPYFIREEYRGRKLSIALLKYILNDTGIQFRYAYDYIRRDNEPSIKASEAVGFKYMSDADVSKFLRTINLCDLGKGKYLIYKCCKNNN